MKLSKTSFTINQLRLAKANQIKALIIVSFHFVVSCVSEPKRILYAQIIMKTTEMVPATPNKKFVVDCIKHGIASSWIFPLRNSFVPAHEQEAFHNIHKLSANVVW